MTTTTPTTTTNREMRRYESLDDFITENKRAGGHFFDDGARSFFRSRWDDGRMYGGRFFITSEQFRDSHGKTEGRRYTVRTALPSGMTGDDIGMRTTETVGGFQAFATLDAARSAARAAAQGYADGMSESPPAPFPRADLQACYEQGRARRRYEANIAPDRWGHTRAGYLREEAREHQEKADALTIEADALDAARADDSDLDAAK